MGGEGRACGHGARAGIRTSPSRTPLPTLLMISPSTLAAVKRTLGTESEALENTRGSSLLRNRAGPTTRESTATARRAAMRYR